MPDMFRNEKFGVFSEHTDFEILKSKGCKRVNGAKAGEPVRLGL
jgi:hypothetical protein